MEGASLLFSIDFVFFWPYLVRFSTFHKELFVCWLLPRLCRVEVATCFHGMGGGGGANARLFG